VRHPLDAPFGARTQPCTSATPKRVGCRHNALHAPTPRICSCTTHSMGSTLGCHPLRDHLRSGRDCRASIATQTPGRTHHSGTTDLPCHLLFVKLLSKPRGPDESPRSTLAHNRPLAAPWTLAVLSHNQRAIEIPWGQESESCKDRTPKLTHWNLLRD